MVGSVRVEIGIIGGESTVCRVHKGHCLASEGLEGKGWGRGNAECNWLS